MLAMRMLFRDVDRLPYLYGLRACAQARGLDVTLVRHQQAGKEDWGQTLRRGDVEAIAENYWALQRYRAAGVPFVTVASAAHRWVEVLLARPGITTLADLRGKKLAARLTGPQASFPKVVLGRAGLLDAVEIVTYSENDTGRWGHWKSVADGTCDACFMLPSYADAARAAGLVEVPFGAFPFDGAHIIPTTTEAYVASKRENVRLLVEAMFDACERVTNDPAWFRARFVEALADLREHFDLPDDAAIDRLCAIQRDEIGTVPIPTPQGIENAYDVALLQYPELAGFNSLVMWDLSFARAAYSQREAAHALAPSVIAAPPGDIRK
jgi:hypothetical protein